MDADLKGRKAHLRREDVAHAANLSSIRTGRLTFYSLLVAIAGVLIMLWQVSTAGDTPTSNTHVTEITQSRPAQTQADAVEELPVQRPEPAIGTLDRQETAADRTQAGSARLAEMPRVEAPPPAAGNIAPAPETVTADRQPSLAARAAFLTGRWRESGESCAYAQEFSIRGDVLDLHEPGGRLSASYRIVDIVGENTAVVRSKGRSGRVIREGVRLRYVDDDGTTHYEAC